MASSEIPPSDRSIRIKGSITGSAFVTGDSNLVSATFRQASLPEPETVDILVELRALQEILMAFNDPMANGVAQKLAEEATTAKPDKSVIATTLETGLTYAKSLSGFTDAIDKLRPHVEATAGWLGKHGYKLLPLVGLTL